MTTLDFDRTREGGEAEAVEPGGRHPASGHCDVDGGSRGSRFQPAGEWLQHQRATGHGALRRDSHRVVQCASGVGRGVVLTALRVVPLTGRERRLRALPARARAWSKQGPLGRVRVVVDADDCPHRPHHGSHRSRRVDRHRVRQCVDDPLRLEHGDGQRSGPRHLVDTVLVRMYRRDRAVGCHRRRPCLQHLPGTRGRAARFRLRHHRHDLLVLQLLRDQPVVAVPAGRGVRSPLASTPNRASRS